jgi:hypothetical protein
MFRFYYALLVLASILPLVNCGGSHHDGGEKYYLVATNVKVPYWQQAASGLVRSAGQTEGSGRNGRTGNVRPQGPAR